MNFPAEIFNRENSYRGRGIPLPDHIQWCPPGRYTGDCSTGLFQVNAIEDWVPLLNAQLLEFRESALQGKCSFPFADFKHCSGPDHCLAYGDYEARVFSPNYFFWGGDDPLTGGVRVRCLWNEALIPEIIDDITKGHLRCLSPTMKIKKESGAFAGTHPNIGGLVPVSALRLIQKINW